MKNKVKIVTALLITALCTTSAYAAENLIKNDSFETELLGTNGWRFSGRDGWVYENENSADCTTDEVHSGEKALHFNSAVVAQRVELKRNVTYTLEFYIKAKEDCTVNVGFFDGSQDWPGSYPVKTKEISVNTDWTKHTIEFECNNTQDYLAYFNLWDKADVYVDDVVLKESDGYISRLMTGVDGDGAISYSADYKGGKLFGVALYDENNKLIGFKNNSTSGTFENVSGYGKYTVKSYLLEDDNLRSKTQEIEYNDDSGKYEDTSIGKAKSLTLSEHNVTMNVDDENKILDAVIMPEFAYDNKVAWKSSDESIVKVSENGILTAVSNGNATITVSSEDGILTDECKVTVTDKKSERLSLNKTSIELTEIDSVYPLSANIENSDLVWKSDNENIASVTDGVVTAKGKGKTTITVSTSDGKQTAKCAVNVNTSDNTITNDTFFKDTDGNYIYSQGGCIQKFGDKYYWYGVKYKEADIYAKNPENGKAGNAAYETFTCYSSDDLVNWKFEGYPLTGEPNGWVGRMGVVYNENTKKYVLISQYAPGMVYAVSDKPAGPFKIDHIQKTLPIQNDVTGDQTLFQDDDGKAYIICSSANGRAYQYVIPLRESDFLDIDEENIKMLFYDEDGSYIDENGEVDKKDKTGIEGNCMFKYNGNYYYTGSDLYGWNSSRVYVMQSDSILGDYNKDTGLPYIMNNTRDSFAHNSQAGFYTTIHGSENDLIIYCGDRWGDFAGNGIGYNQWVPLSFDKEGKPYFNNLHQWKLDAEKGTWEVGEGNNYISNPEFEADRKITATPTGWKVRDNVGNYSVSNARGKVDSGNFVIQETAPEDYISDLYQEITDLPNGTYTMTAWVKSSGGQNVCNVYAQSGDEKKTYSVKTNIDDWKEIVVATDIKVTDGKCTVGLYSDAHANEWVQMDNVRLVKNIE